MMRLGLFVAAFFSIVTAFAQPAKTAEPAIPTFTVSEILAQRVEYDGRLVRIRASLFATDEGVWFVDYGCPGVVSTNDHVWPSSIWMQVASSEMGPRYSRSSGQLRFRLWE